MNRSINAGSKAGKKSGGKFEQKFSFSIALITLVLILGYFIQSFMHIYEQEIIVVAIDRIEGGRKQ